MTQTPTFGPMYPASRARPELLEQRRPGEHVWVCIASWRCDGETLLKAHRQEQDTNMIWDAENLASFTVGCYVCEEQFTERLYHRRCTGEPGR